MKNLRLTIEMVPQTSWYNNVRSNVSETEWNLIKRKCSLYANNRCEICGETGLDQGFGHNVECHEIWEYDDVNHKQKLVGLISLCPYCHKTKHIGLAEINGELDIVIKQLMKVNHMSKKEAVKYIQKCSDIWVERSQYKWDVDISFLDDFFVPKFPFEK